MPRRKLLTLLFFRLFCLADFILAGTGNGQFLFTLRSRLGFLGFANRPPFGFNLFLLDTDAGFVGFAFAPDNRILLGLGLRLGLRLGTFGGFALNAFGFLLALQRRQFIGNPLGFRPLSFNGRLLPFPLDTLLLQPFALDAVCFRLLCGGCLSLNFVDGLLVNLNHRIQFARQLRSDGIDLAPELQRGLFGGPAHPLHVSLFLPHLVNVRTGVLVAELVVVVKNQLGIERL
jgi:hypothetical protein